MPERAAHVLSLIRQTRDGKENDATFGRRMTGTGPYAWTIGRRFELACARLGINRDKTKLADRCLQAAAAARRTARAIVTRPQP